MAVKVFMSTVVCVGYLLVSCDAVRVDSKENEATEGLPGGPASWWETVEKFARMAGVGGQTRASVADILFIIPKGLDDERVQADQPPIEGQIRKDLMSYLQGLGDESVKIEKLNRLQANCSNLTVIGPFALPVFSWQSFKAVMRLAREFMLESEPRDLFSLMPQNSAKAVERWIYKRVAHNKTDLNNSNQEFNGWLEERHLPFTGKTQEESMFFNGVSIRSFHERHPDADKGEMPFPVEITYFPKIETFDKGLIDAVNEDWERVPKHEQSVARDAFLTYFRSKPEASKFSERGERYLEEALEGAFDVCTQMTSPASANLDEHGFRYAATLAAEMFKTLTTTAACDE